MILTATLQSGDVTDTKVFEVTVKQKLTPEEIVNGDAEALTLSGLAAVSDNLNLPSAGEYGSTITWESSEPDIIAADGTVTRPVGDPDGNDILWRAFCYKRIYGDSSSCLRKK